MTVFSPKEAELLAPETVTGLQHAKTMMSILGYEFEFDRIRLAPLLEGFAPAKVFTQLPMRLDPDGRFQLQVRPGLWDVRVTGRGLGDINKLAAPRQPAHEHWPDSEIWVFDARPAMRLVELSGVPSIDPTQVPLPEG